VDFVATVVAPTAIAIVVVVDLLGSEKAVWVAVMNGHWMCDEWDLP